MKIGLFTSGYQRNPLEHAFEDAQRFGYDYIELWGGRPHAYAPDLLKGEVSEILKWIDKYSMPVEIYTPEHNAYPYNFMIGSELQRQDAIEYLKRAMDAAKLMGAHSTLMSPAHAGYYASHKDLWKRLVLCMQELTDYAEKIDHNIILEALTPFESNVCTTANDLAEVFSAVKSSALFGMCDVVPAYIQHESILAYFHKLGSKMKHIHLIDTDGHSDTHIVPGDGVIPFKQLIAQLKAIKYEGTATIELVTAYINEPRFYAQKAIEQLKSFG